MSVPLLIYGHFMRQTPFSLLVLPSFAWRTEDREGRNGFACGANTMELNSNNYHAGAAYSPLPLCPELVEWASRSLRASVQNSWFCFPFTGVP